MNCPVYFWLLLTFLGNAFIGNCQSPYELKNARELILSGAGFGIAVPGFYLSQNKRLLTDDEINRLKKENVGRFNRAAINHYSVTAGRTSDFLLYASLASPLLLLGDQTIRKNSLQTGIIYFESILIASVGINLSKGLVRRPRPYTYNPNVSESLKRKNDATNSFFSGHTAMSAASAIFTAKLYSDYYHDSRWKPVAWIGAAALPLATGYCRIRAGQHFLTDVLTGYCWGALAGILIPELHRIEKISN